MCAVLSKHKHAAYIASGFSKLERRLAQGLLQESMPTLVPLLSLFITERTVPWPRRSLSQCAGRRCPLVRCHGLREIPFGNTAYPPALLETCSRACVSGRKHQSSISFPLVPTKHVQVRPELLYHIAQQYLNQLQILHHRCHRLPANPCPAVKFCSHWFKTKQAQVYPQLLYPIAQ